MGGGGARAERSGGSLDPRVGKRTFWARASSNSVLGFARCSAAPAQTTAWLGQSRAPGPETLRPGRSSTTSPAATFPDPPLADEGEGRIEEGEPAEAVE
jgi:hypothetical protein